MLDKQTNFGILLGVIKTMIKMRMDVLAVSAVAALLLGTAGCTSPTSTATGEGVGERAGKAVDTGAETVKEGAKDAGETVAKGAEHAGEAVKGAADTAGEAVGGAAKTAGEAVKGAAAVTTLTPKIKNALIVSKIDASTINVNTDATKKMVMLEGTIPTADLKALATKVATKTLVDSASDYKVQNNLKVGK